MAIKPVRVEIPENAPYLPPRANQEIAWALKGLHAGEADKGQQTMAINWIIFELARYQDMSYRPNSARDSDFAEGKRYCGAQLVRLIQMTPERISKLPRLGAATQEDDDSIRNM